MSPKEQEARVYPDPRYVYQHVAAFGCDTIGARIGSVVVECTPGQCRKLGPEKAVRETMYSVLRIDPLTTCTPMDGVYKDHDLEKMVDQYKKFDTRFMSIVDREEETFDDIEKYETLPAEVRKLYTGERRCKVLDDGSRKMV